MLNCLFANVCLSCFLHPLCKDKYFPDSRCTKSVLTYKKSTNNNKKPKHTCSQYIDIYIFICFSLYVFIGLCSLYPHRKGTSRLKCDSSLFVFDSLLIIFILNRFIPFYIFQNCPSRCTKPIEPVQPIGSHSYGSRKTEGLGFRDASQIRLRTSPVFLRTLFPDMQPLHPSSSFYNLD